MSIAAGQDRLTTSNALSFTSKLLGALGGVISIMTAALLDLDVELLVAVLDVDLLDAELLDGFKMIEAELLAIDIAEDELFELNVLALLSTEDV